MLTDNKFLAKLLLILSITPIAGALLSQYGFGLKPCDLCIWQRIPYFVIIFFALISVIKPNLKLFLISTVIIIHAFLIDAGIAFYHVGVEKHWWIHGDCASTLDMSSMEALRKSILSTPAVRCDEVQFEFLGLSMAGWNFIYALSAGIFSIYALIKFMKFRVKSAK
jgi:disulfide bond formation protein DsbB